LTRASPLCKGLGDASDTTPKGDKQPSGGATQTSYFFLFIENTS